MEELINAGEKYDVQMLKHHIGKLFLKALNISTCCMLMRLALQYSIEVLRLKCEEMIKENIHEIVTTPSYANLMADYPRALQVDEPPKKRLKH